MKKNHSKITPKQSMTIEDSFFMIGCILTVITAAAAAASFFHPGYLQNLRMPPCLFHILTGYYCPGCGGTRAVKALFHGHILKAVYYHPLVPYAAVVYLSFMSTQAAERISRGKFAVGMHYHNCYVWIAAAIITANFILKNILHHFYGFLL